MNEWLNHPALKNMDPVKLELIKLAAKQTEGKNGKSLAPVMMSLSSLRRFDSSHSAASSSVVGSSLGTGIGWSF